MGSNHYIRKVLNITNFKISLKVVIIGYFKEKAIPEILVLHRNWSCSIFCRLFPAAYSFSHTLKNGNGNEF
jgi:hypothetical protein